MHVGVNYPWRDYGWDFGVAPSDWRPVHARPRWMTEIDAHLDRFRALGIRVVRWFLLGDGLTYGTGADAPRYGSDDAWHFDPPSLDTIFLEHFEELLRRFSDSNARGGPRIQVLPVLLDFHFCHPGKMTCEGWIKGGRADAIAERLNHQRFLDGALDPLLGVSAKYPDAVYAWEIMNEPEWVTLGWDPRIWRTPAIDDLTMGQFLEEGCSRVRRAGFPATIGFALRDTLLASRVATDVDQFHYYPDGAHHLGRAPHRPGFPLILGEFASAFSDRWPDLPEWDQGVLNRLRLAADRGFDLAMPWSFLAADRHTAWSAAVEADIERFTQHPG